MTLWEREIIPLQDRLRLGRLSETQMLALAVNALDYAYRTEPDPVDEPEEACCLEAGIEAGQAAVASGESRITLTEELRDEFDKIADDAPDPGVLALLSAIMICVEHESLSNIALSEALYQCYEFTAHRQELEDRTIEHEEENERCREVIEYQKQLITQATT